MATVGSHKGNKGRQYGLILLLAFGVALLGVMALHRVRERHIFNNLIQEKDRELNSLQLLLQRERDQNMELKRKSEEVKGRLYSLGAQRMELDNRLLEMKSRVDSIKEEQKTMESTLDEKQNEIKWLKEKYTDSVKESPNLTVLMGRLKQKESEIEDLKHQLESSFSADDPSKQVIGSGSIIIAAKDENLTRAEQGSKNNSTHVREDLNDSAITAAKNREATTGLKEMARERTENSLTSSNKDSIDGVTTGRGNNSETEHKKTENLEDGESAVENDEKNVADAAEANMHNGHDTGKLRSKDSEDIKKTEDRHQEKLGNSHKENREPRKLPKDAMRKLVPKNLRGADISVKGRHRLLSRMIAKDTLLQIDGNSESSAVEGKSSRFPSHGPNELKRTKTSASIHSHGKGETGQSKDQEVIERAESIEARNKSEEEIEVKRKNTLTKTSTKFER